MLTLSVKTIAIGFTFTFLFFFGFLEGFACEIFTVFWGGATTFWIVCYHNSASSLNHVM